ncbi:hypothetical protein [Micromonospora sp. WMMD1082]|uniref:hypothetical protein n=1 Tax=Micromonospora sp. WMMD1082 TaxID=3016104 RepID=UPI002417F5C9|nr:hypothetical protein [Micromonospora sp. WMMD1082]MDG4795088.1 hypothetical protein [Micromonospora sp. WMMD1082]
MKAAFGAEAIGLGYENQSTDLINGLPPDLRAPVADAVGVEWTGRRVRDPINRRPWAAEIIGLHERYGFDRRFLTARVDYSDASSTGNRGVWFWWTFASGHVYEVSYRTSWGSGHHRRYLTVSDDGDVIDMSAEEVRQWLSAHPASTF